MLFNLYSGWCCIFNSVNIFFSLPYYLSKFSINVLHKSVMPCCSCYCIKEYQCQGPKKICYQGTSSLQITMTGRNILAVVNKLCQKHRQWNSNMLMLQMQFDISEQIHVWTQNQHWSIQSYLSVILVIYWSKMFYWKATY